METEAAVDERPDEAPDEPSRRRRLGRTIALVVVGLLVVAIGGMAFLVLREQPDIVYEGPDGVVAPGAEVTIRDPDGPCGPLVVSLHRRGRLGLWSQTHSGSFSAGFTPDARRWWWPGGGTYFTPVPCGPDGEITFTLPADLAPGTIAVCDSGGDCAEIRVG